MDFLKIKDTFSFRRRGGNVNLWRSNSLSNVPKLKGNNETALVKSSGNRVVSLAYEDFKKKSPPREEHLPGFLKILFNYQLPAKLPGATEEPPPSHYDKLKKINRSWDTIVTIVLVEAKCLPPVPEDGVSHNIYCKFRLGSETFTSKSVPNCQRAEWRERFQLHLFEEHSLHLTLHDKGKMKNAMGSCVIDLSLYEKERTHEIWQELGDGYGVIHISLTMCAIRPAAAPDNAIVSNDCDDRHRVQELPPDWNVVGLLHIKVICARGFTRKPNAYCTLEIDNERVETHRAGPSAEPHWNKCYIFKVYDVSSTLDLKVYDKSITNAILNESIGKVSIPLLKISNGLTRWYALKDRTKRNSAKGNCPRILLQMTLVWNPVKATLRLFQSKEVKYIRRPEKFDIPLIYSNMKYVSDLLALLQEINEYYKRLFEWEDREFSFFMLLGWLIFCNYLRLWNTPLLLLTPYIYNLIFNRHRDTTYKTLDNANKEMDIKDEKSFSGKINDLKIMTFTIKNGIEFMVSYIERLQSLITFKVPFLSYVSMIILIVAAAVLYLIPFNYLLMGLGVYKFTRKFLNPDRVLNNDLIDFLSRVPDSEILKDWKELGVPEPNQEYKENKSNVTTSIGVSI